MTRPKSRYQPGDKIGGRYQVHQVEMGGMGEVYLCLDLEEMYPFALKTFQQRYQSIALRQAFEQEVATWVALEKHPNIVRCFHMDIQDNQPFMVLEWIANEEGKGTDLRHWLHHGPLELKLAIEIIVDVCRGLTHAHEKRPGLVHRDLKPENILIGQGRLAKITDFGLAEIAHAIDSEIDADTVNRDGRQSLVGLKRIVGTPAYMAPEQWRGEVLDERTDIYAAGCILYEMLTGELPFQVDLVPSIPKQLQQYFDALQFAHETGPLPGLSSRIPAGLYELLLSCLAKTRAERPASMADLLDQLEVLYEKQTGSALKAPSVQAHYTAFDFINRANTYDKLGQYELALDDHNRAIKLSPTIAGAYLNRGVTYSNLSQTELALADFEHAIKLDPYNTLAYSNRGIVHAKSENLELALTDYKRAIELDPENSLAYYNRGRLYQGLRQYDLALADYNRVVEINPRYAEAYGNRGNTYGKLQRYEAALADYNRAIELNLIDTKVYYNRGVLYGTLGQYKKAILDFNRALELDPRSTEAYYNRGTIYQQLEQYDKALVDLGRAIELDPTLTNAYSNRGAIYERAEKSPVTPLY